MDHQEVARKLLAAYEASGKSYADLAAETGISKATIQRYFTGTTGKIPTDRLEILCRVLGLDVSEMLGWGMNEPGVEYRTMTPQQALLFDAAEDLTDSERQAVINMINAFKAARGG